MGMTPLHQTKALFGTFHERYDMDPPPTPVRITYPLFVSTPSLLSLSSLLFFIPHCPWQYVAFASSITLVGVDLTLY